MVTDPLPLRWRHVVWDVRRLVAEWEVVSAVSAALIFTAGALTHGSNATMTAHAAICGMAVERHIELH
jgi:hypothetical protein